MSNGYSLTSVSAAGPDLRPVAQGRSLVECPHPAITSLSPSMNAGSHPRALVVDDEPAVRRVMVRTLQRWGIEVEQCALGEDALARVRTGDIDLVLTDIAMPGMGGVQLLQAIRAQDPDLPVILLTGAPSLDTAISAVEHGATRYLLKPFDVQKMEAAVLDAVARARERSGRLAGLQSAPTPDAAPCPAVTLDVFHQAVERIWIAFQPIVHSQGGRVFGYESLTRSSDQSLPHIGVLLKAAEALDLLPVLGRRIRRLAAEAMAPHPERGVLFLNLHPLDLLDPDLYDPTSPLGLMAGRTILEITERAALDDIGEVETRLAALRAMGFRIAVDDLGAGYSGLSSLVSLRPDVVKIDMSLVRNVHADPVKSRLVRTIVGLCHDLGIQVVAEGIEQEAERGTCASLGADLLQGYLIARPARPFPEVEGSAAGGSGKVPG